MAGGGGGGSSGGGASIYEVTASIGGSLVHDGDCTIPWASNLVSTHHLLHVWISQPSVLQSHYPCQLDQGHRSLDATRTTATDDVHL